MKSLGMRSFGGNSYGEGHEGDDEDRDEDTPFLNSETMSYQNNGIRLRHSERNVSKLHSYVSQS